MLQSEQEVWRASRLSDIQSDRNAGTAENTHRRNDSNLKLREMYFKLKIIITSSKEVMFI